MTLNNFSRHIFSTRTCVWHILVAGLAVLAVLQCAFSAAPAEAALSPVEIRGDRFYSGGQPYFPSTHFLLGAGYIVTHAYLSGKNSDADRAEILNSLSSKGYNAIFLYPMNEGDYNGARTTPYKNESTLIGGDFDDAKLSWWRADMQKMINMNLRPVIWLFPDDSPKIKNASVTELKRYIKKMVDTFDDLPVMWVLALEVDEYWSKSRSDELGSYLNSLADNPVGLHQLSNRTDYMTSSWVQFGMMQYGVENEDDWQHTYDITKSAKNAMGNRPVIAGEYYYERDNSGSFPLGIAAAFAGAAGVGTGAPGGLDEFMESLPDDMTPSRSGNTLTLTGGGVTATANISNLSFSKSGGSGSGGSGGGTGGGSMLFNIALRHDQVDPGGPSGLWWSWEDEQQFKPRLVVRYNDGSDHTNTYQHNAGDGDCEAAYIRPSGAGSGKAGLSQGAKHNLLVKESPAAHAFMKCDISGIPAGATIEEATLHLHLHTEEGLANSTDEGIVGVYESAQSGWDWDTMSWSEYDSGKPWSSAGGDFGPKIRDIRVREDIRNKGWSKSGNPNTEFDFTAYVKDLQQNRGSGGSGTGGTSGSSGCNLYGAGDAIGVGFGVPWSTLSSSRPLLLNSQCDGNSALIRLGTGGNYQYIYKDGYRWTGSAWSPVNFVGTQLIANAWFVGDAYHVLSNISSGVTFWVGYVCEWTGTVWKCGCRDSTCTTAYWQLQGISSSGSNSSGGSSSGGSSAWNSLGNIITVDSGTTPGIATDSAGNIHLVYMKGNNILYRKGTASGSFGAAETIPQPAGNGNYNSPHVVVDANNVPHVTFEKNWTSGSQTAWYTNRIGGSWKQPIVALSMPSNRRVNKPRLAVSGTTAYVAGFTPFDDGSTENRKGHVAKIDNINGSPSVSKTIELSYWLPHVLISGSNVYVIGRKGPSGHFVQQFNLNLVAQGSEKKISNGTVGKTLEGFDVAITGSAIDVIGLALGSGTGIDMWYTNSTRWNGGQSVIRKSITHEELGEFAHPAMTRDANGTVYAIYKESEGGPGKITSVSGNSIAAGVTYAPSLTKYRRWTSQMAPAQGDGVWVTWDAGGNVLVRSVGVD